ncbi:Uncharacterised protein [Neisseria meningitidis]|nr:Uncharacterised protein [Neisseria meningitidis]
MESCRTCRLYRRRSTGRQPHPLGCPSVRSNRFRHTARVSLGCRRVQTFAVAVGCRPIRCRTLCRRVFRRCRTDFLRLCRFQLFGQTPRAQRCFNPYRLYRADSSCPFPQSRRRRLCRRRTGAARLFFGSPARDCRLFSARYGLDADVVGSSLSGSICPDAALARTDVFPSVAKQAFDVDGSRLTCLCPAAYDRLPAALGKNAARAVRAMARRSRFRYVRRRAARSDGIQFVLLSEKPALVCIACAAAGGLDGMPHASVFDRLGDFGRCVDGCRFGAACRQSAAFSGQPRLAAATACPVRRGATGQPEARRGGVCQLVRHYGVRTVCRVPVDGLFCDELRLARQACRTCRLFQPVLCS